MNGLTLNTSMMVGDAMVRGFVEGVSVRRHEARLLGRGALALSRRFAPRSIGHGPLVPRLVNLAFCGRRSLESFERVGTRSDRAHVVFLLSGGRQAVRFRYRVRALLL